jgi:hypothetical protein
VKDRGAILPDDTRDVYLKYYRGPRMLKAVAAGRKVSSATDTPRGVAVSLYWLLAEKDEALADEFFQAWSTATFGGRMRALKKASQYLAELKKASRVRVQDLVQFAAWIHCWNLVCRKQVGHKDTSFVYDPGAPFPQIKGPA